MEPLAPHERVFVDTDLFEDENHGDIACEDCHGGNPDEADWDKAHEGITRDPTYPTATEACGDCHDEIDEVYPTSLHVTLAHYKTAITARADPSREVHERLEGARVKHCDSCHASCGQCHVSRPNTVGGGLLDGHLFQKRPPVREVCTACHGSRVQKEYFGEIEGLVPDIHAEKRFACSKCHSGAEMHGTGKAAANRYVVENAPRCIDCHEEVFAATSEHGDTHREHKDLVTCQVCHSQSYKNCATCHVASDPSGQPYFKNKSVWIDFTIGFNPIRSPDRPEKFTLLRHIPVDRDTFAHYVDNGLTNFDQVPTWKHATPHNIRRQTPQNKNCNNCHGKPELFLLKKNVAEVELQANKTVIVPEKDIPKRQ